ncbi:MAG: alpha/beta fold hydrolase, partial [Chloroflexi bacterium]|nr:alpha/beta fold hydrolase [Chloroflexota bacterium]
TLFYDLVGDGQVFVVMHGGLGADHTMYRSLDPLAQARRLLYYDHRGNGRSSRPALETLTMEQLADDAASLIAQITDEKVILFGHSYGGFVAQEFALRHPERLAALILCDTTPGQLGEGEDESESKGPPPPAEFIELISNPPANDEELAIAMQTMLPLYLHRASPTDLEPSFAKTIFDLKAMNRGFELLSTWSSVDRLHSIILPTLLLVGSHDLFTAPPQSYRIAGRIPHAEVVEFSESGHIPWIDEPEQFFKVVVDWLNRQ